MHIVHEICHESWARQKPCVVCQSPVYTHAEVRRTINCINWRFCRGTFFDHKVECEKALSFIRCDIVTKCLKDWKTDGFTEKVRLAKVELRNVGILQFEKRKNDKKLGEIISFHTKEEETNCTTPVLQ